MLQESRIFLLEDVTGGIFHTPKECGSCRVRAAGQQRPALARAAPISPPPAPQPQCPHSPTRSRFRKLTPGITVLERHALRRTRSPWSAAPPLRARTPAGKSSHLGQSISHPLHAVPCESSKPKSSHRARGNQCSYYGLEIRQGLSSLNPCFI